MDAVEVGGSIRGVILEVSTSRQFGDGFAKRKFTVTGRTVRHLSRCIPEP
jgi:hypothetical protein